MSTILIASDHAGFALKERLKSALQKKGYQVDDLGTQDENSVDYPDFAHRLAKQIEKAPSSQGILICGTGIGMSMAANRHPNVRAALVTNDVMARAAKQHNNANVLVLGGRVLSAEQALALVQIWLEEKYEGGRHERRLEKL